MKIREVLRLLRDDGWYLDRTRGSHRQFRHPVKKGTVTVAGAPSDDVHPKTLRSIFRQAELEKIMKLKKREYTVIYEKGTRNWSAYVPDLPGCIATAKTQRQLEGVIREAIEFHIEGLIEHGERVPEPTVEAGTVRVVA